MEEKNVVSGDTETKKEAPVAPPEPVGETHHQWKQRIREEALTFYPQSRIFEEYNDDCNCYEFYYYNLDYQEECIVLKKKDIETIYAFMKKTEAEQRWRKTLK